MHDVWNPGRELFTHQVIIFINAFIKVVWWFFELFKNDVFSSLPVWSSCTLWE